jgi:predicted transcriptional regulator
MVNIAISFNNSWVVYFLTYRFVERVETMKEEESEWTYNRVVKLLNLLKKKGIITEKEYKEVYDVI